MSYIGSTPTTQSFIAGTDYFNGDGTTVNFTMSRAVNSVNDIEVIVNNVEQIPSGYSVSGTTLTFSAAPSAGTSNVYVRYLSTTLLSVAPTQGSSMQFGIGSAALPSISFTGDTNTGIFSPAADTIGFSEGGAEAARFDASGNLCVGSTAAGNPATKSVSVGLAGTTTGGIQLWSPTTSAHSVQWGDGTSSTDPYRGYIEYDHVSDSMRFATSSTERARINANGYFKASNTGTYQDATGAQHELRANNANGYVLIVSNTNGTPLSEYIQDWRFTAATPNNTSARFWNCEDATVNRAYLATNGGLANYSANNSNLSDRREKTNFAPAKSYLDVVCAIPVQTFNYIDQNLEEDAGLTLGVVAQDVQAVAPELVTESNWGTEENPKMRLSIYQTDLQYALMKCIQEQQALITQQAAAITALTTRITALENNNATQ